MSNSHLATLLDLTQNFITTNPNVTEIRVIVLSHVDTWHTVFGSCFDQRQLDTSLPAQTRLYLHHDKLLLAIKPNHDQFTDPKVIAQICNQTRKSHRRIQGVQLMICYPSTNSDYQEQSRILELTNNLCSYIHFQTKVQFLINNWSPDTQHIWHQLPPEWHSTPWGISAVGRAKNWQKLCMKLDNWIFGQLIPLSWQTRSTNDRLMIFSGIQELSKSIASFAGKINTPEKRKICQKLTGLWLLPSPDAKRSIATLETLVWQRKTPYKSLKWHLSAYFLATFIIVSILTSMMLNPGIQSGFIAKLTTLPNHATIPTLTQQPPHFTSSQHPNQSQPTPTIKSTIPQLITQNLDNKAAAIPHAPAPIPQPTAHPTNKPIIQPKSTPTSQPSPLPASKHTPQTSNDSANSLVTPIVEPQHKLIPVANRPWRVLHNSPTDLHTWTAWAKIINLSQDEWDNMRNNSQEYPEYTQINWHDYGEIRKIIKKSQLISSWQQLVNDSQANIAQHVYNHIQNHNEEAFIKLDQLLNQVNGTSARTVSSWRTWTHKFTLKNYKNHLQQEWENKIIPTYNFKLKNKYPITQSSELEIQALEFTKMFGPQGHIETWLTKHDAIIDKSHSKWRWRTFYGHPIGNSEENLTAIYRGHIIRSIIWDGDNKPRKFTYQTQLDKIAPPINVINWKIDNQAQIQQQRPQQPETYPPMQATITFNSPPQISINLSNNDGKETNLAFTGPWSFQHFIKETHAKSTSQSNKFKLSIPTYAADNASQNFTIIANDKLALGYLKTNMIVSDWKITEDLFGTEN